MPLRGWKKEGDAERQSVSCLEEGNREVLCATLECFFVSE